MTKNILNSLSFEEIIRNTGFSSDMIFRKMVRRGVFIVCQDIHYYMNALPTERL